MKKKDIKKDISWLGDPPKTPTKLGPISEAISKFKEDTLKDESKDSKDGLSA